jgi:hypothetical protein
VLLHQTARLAGRPVVDPNDLRQRMVAERLDIFAGHPAGAEDGYAVLLSQSPSPLPKTVGSLCSPDHGVKKRGPPPTNTQ